MTSQPSVELSGMYPTLETPPTDEQVGALSGRTATAGSKRSCAKRVSWLALGCLGVLALGGAFFLASEPKVLVDTTYRTNDYSCCLPLPNQPEGGGCWTAKNLTCTAKGVSPYSAEEAAANGPTANEEPVHHYKHGFNKAPYMTTMFSLAVFGTVAGCIGCIFGCNADKPTESETLNGPLNSDVEQPVAS